MKKVLFFAMAALTCMSCAAKKPVAQQPAPQPVQQESETQRKIRELKEQKELQELQNEMELQQMQADAKKKRLATTLAMEEQMADGDQVMVTFCYEESMDKPGEYMAGLGISQPRRFERDAKEEANNVAIHDIASRFMGVLKSGTDYYSQSGLTPGGKALDEASLQSMTLNIVEVAVNKYANQVCYKSIQDNDGMYRFYLALHIMESKTVDEVAEQLDKQQLLHDKNSFKKQLLNQLDAESAKRAAAQERQLQMLKELEE
ncbi:MAG: hypothetical protein MJZ88_00920 [Paludibacteraceae bacterium]|nr:hypothetical protein [Paludibacteraceae bacterium]